MLLGDKGDQPVSQAIEQALAGKTLNLTGKTTVLEAASFIKRAVGFIGNDSGLMHLAELVGVPVLPGRVRGVWHIARRRRRPADRPVRAAAHAGDCHGVRDEPGVLRCAHHGPVP